MARWLFVGSVKVVWAKGTTQTAGSRHAFADVMDAESRTWCNWGEGAMFGEFTDVMAAPLPAPPELCEKCVELCQFPENIV